MTDERLNLTQEWDKVFPKSDKVDHKKVTFHNRYGITLAADLYTPKNAVGELPAIAVSAGALRTVWIRCAKSTAARRKSISNKESVISAQRQHAAAQDDEKTEVHAHCQRLRLTAGMCLGFVLRGERQ